MHSSVESIQRAAEDLAARLGEMDFKVSAKPTHDGSLHIEVSDAYYLVVSERGMEVDRKRTKSSQELLFWVMDRLISSMAWDYELAHRRKGEDVRRQGFAKQIELMAQLSSEWAERKRRELSEILSLHPFNDT